MVRTILLLLVICSVICLMTLAEPHRHRPHGHRPHGPRPHGHRPHGHKPHGPRPHGPRPHVPHRHGVHRPRPRPRPIPPRGKNYKTIFIDQLTRHANQLIKVPMK